MTDQQLTLIWLVTHDFGDGESLPSVWTTEDKANAQADKRKALIAGKPGDEGWQRLEDGPLVTWAHEEYNDSVTIIPLNVDEAQ